jgi:DNA-binding NarL/FixJ family response regulator
MMMREKIKIILADDEILFRKGLSFLLERESYIEILYEASDGSELLQYLSTAPVLPQIILMDLKMPMLNGVEATKIIRRTYPSIKVIALTSYNTQIFIANMIQEGAASYLVKNAHPNEMLKTITEVAERGYYYNEAVISVIVENRESGKKAESMFSDFFLNDREKEIIELICLQYSTNEIADKLFLSPRTVEGYRNSLMKKTSTKNLAGLVVFAIQNGIIDPDILILKS